MTSPAPAGGRSPRRRDDPPTTRGQREEATTIRWNALRHDAQALWRSAHRAVTTSGPERDTTVQSLKAAGAGVLAWALAGWWWSAPMALLAPWTALFLVQSTVYRSVRSAMQQLAVVMLGTLLAAGAAVVTGNNSLVAMAIVLPITVLLSTYARFGTQGVYAPTAALFVLAYGTYSGVDILHRLFETLLGAVIGIAVNALVLPPVHGRDVWHLRKRLPQESADLLHTVADGIEEETYDPKKAQGWYDRAQRLTDLMTDLRSARRWTDESYRFNPGRKLRRSVPHPPGADWDFTWDRITEHIRTTVRAVTETREDRPSLADLPEEAPGILAELLRAAGDVCEFDDSDTRPAGRQSPPETERDRRRAMDRANAAHDRLARLLTDSRYRATPALGGLAADTQRLLSDLAAIGNPEADGTESSDADADADADADTHSTHSTRSTHSASTAGR
ncbi:FUSC family protein [Streptomyces sp. G44]|uniref:FUSC family protein n=1 Tax=Streptomyces sp. G44 TaxID=2807632 RepID=UPI001961D159|nr:aromatic acid exporter family protein [Streptomyces sp. G44]MBM7171054.1 FUSC family protein [Streptomyces sp. G44]